MSTPRAASAATVAQVSGGTLSREASRLNEAQLSAIWRGQRFPKGALVTRAGVPVTVIFQGRAGRGPGPDFRGGVIAGPSGVPLRGDIELHVRASDFRAHGHGADPAYSGVILHVVFEDDTGADTPLPGGGTAPVIALAPWVARRAEDLGRWLQQPLLWREPCHSAFVRLGADRVAAALDAEGDRRLAAKCAQIDDAIRASGVEQTIYERLLEALGFGGNGPPMLALARSLRWERLRELLAGAADRRFAAEAALLGAAGLLPSQRGHRGPVEPYVDQLELSFGRSGADSLDPGIWKRWGMRPVNMPARRIAAAAALLSSIGEPSSLLQSLHALTAADLAAPLTGQRARGYWLNHHDPCSGSSRLPPAFIGRSRALEIAANVLIPAAITAGGDELAERARAWWTRLPRPASYGATRFIETALASEGMRLPLNARRGQGLLALHRDWCTQNGCGRCPLS